MSALEGPSGPLVFESPSSDGAFLLTGRRAALDGHARMGVACLKGARGEMIRALKAEQGDCRRFRYSPGSLLREIEAPGGTLREVILVPRDLPGAVFQWSLDEGAEEHSLRVSFRPGEKLSLSENGGEPEGLVATLTDRRGSRTVFMVSPADAGWRLGDGDGSPRLVADLSPGTSALLAVVEADSPPGPALFDRIRGWERARAGEETQAEEELLGAHAPGTELREGISWARARLECPVLDRPSSDATWIGLASLCSGRFDLARQALAILARDLDEKEALADAHRLLDEQTALWAGGWGRNTPEDPIGIPVPVGAPPGVLTRASLAARADPVQLARALCTFVVGTLGARPDAGFGRLRLAPGVPSHWSRLDVRNLPMADTRVALGYRREGQLHTFTLRQTGGAVPANLVFEPRVPGAELVSARVDGEPAELDVFRRRGWVGTRLQFPLDPERRVTLEGRDDD